MESGSDFEVNSLKFFLCLSVQTEPRSNQPDRVIKNMPEMANLVYNTYMHMIQSTQQYRQVRNVSFVSRVNDSFISSLYEGPVFVLSGRFNGAGNGSDVRELF